MGRTLMVVSVEPETSLFSNRCRQRTVPEWPSSVITDHGELVRMFHTCVQLLTVSTAPPETPDTIFELRRWV